MSRNVEIKASVKDIEDIIQLAKELTGEEPIELKQHDIFYKSPNGRLKLRCVEEREVSKSELIWYDRPDVAGPKLSDFNKVEIPSEALKGLKATLASSMGIKGEVKKQRWLFIYEKKTRIHIDRVDGLGDFMELEVCLDKDESVMDGEMIARKIQDRLKVSDDQLLTCAYMDMLVAKQ